MFVSEHVSLSVIVLGAQWVMVLFVRQVGRYVRHDLQKE